MRQCNPPVIKGPAADDISQPDQCKRPEGGDMTVKPPAYSLTVNNPDVGMLDFFQDETGAVVVDDTPETLIL